MSTSILRMIKDIFWVCLLYVWSVQLARPFDPALICLHIPGQLDYLDQFCIEHPKTISAMAGAVDIYFEECDEVFKSEVWSCSKDPSPIFTANVDRNITNHEAFKQAMISAIVAQNLSKECASGILSSECGCDMTLNGQYTIQGWKWGSCSDNVDYGLMVAKEYIDYPETVSDAVEKAQANLHNNAVGRRVVQDEVKTKCRCHGLSGSCTIKTCWNEAPTASVIATILKEKYDSAQQVQVDIPNFGGQPTLRYLSKEQDHLQPQLTELVYLQQSTDLCLTKANYTQGKVCLPQAMADQEGLNQEQSNLTPCESLCCSGQHYTTYGHRNSTCDCVFLWCCEVHCRTCVESFVEYRCTG